MIIKASSITNLTDARYFAAKEVAYLGFNLEPGTEDFLDPIYMKAIREWVEGPKIVGEFSTSPAAQVREAAAFYGLDTVQLRALAYEEQLADFAGLDILLDLTVPRGFSKTQFKRRLQRLAPLVQGFVLDFARTGITWGEAFVDIGFWQDVCAEYATLLHVDVSAERVAQIREKLPRAGLVLRGGAEEKVGMKSFDDIESIFEALEA